ncbi:hypothetical protein NC652_011009 [Populus alba x Populus x berolinensis]|nr:hypothetical protein NC652_011009 [Populus alba x Populus x berolinensis]
MLDLGISFCVCMCVWPFLLSVISAQDDGIVDTNYFGTCRWWRCCLQIFRVKCVEVEVSFMSIQAISFLGEIGLLGEYTPSLRKKGRPLSDKVGCMHLGPFKGYPEFSGCSLVQPYLITEKQSSLFEESSEDIIVANLSLHSSSGFQ